MSNTKFLCARLLLCKDGSMKRVSLQDGGDTREFTINGIDMGFEEIHQRLREIFLVKTNCPSKLYDFECKELDTSQYTTFYDYIQRNGLILKSTLLYLGTSADAEDLVIPRSPERQTTTLQPIQNLDSVVRIQQVEADSSTPLITIQTDNDLPSTNSQPRIDCDDDQSSEASHSSIGDEVLMEIAQGAYEQRSNRFE